MWQDYYTPSDDGFQVFDTPHGRIGVVVCFDRHYLESICSTVGAITEYSEEAASTTLCHLLSTVRQVELPDQDNRWPPRNTWGEHYMDSGPALDGVAAQLGISPSYLSRIFSEIDGKRFTQYLSGLCIKKAKQLPADDSRLVRDIGQDVGFLTIQHFMRVFKAKTGVPPGEYRSALPKKTACKEQRSVPPALQSALANRRKL